MSLLSIRFLLFFLILILGYYILPSKIRWVWLLLGSLTFYAIGSLKCLPLLLFTALQTYGAALLLGKLNKKIREDLKRIEDRTARKAEKEKLIQEKKGIVAVSLILNFAILFAFKTSYLWHGVPLVLPLGISFYTFQTIGYLIDVYRARFVERKFEGKMLRRGFWLFLWGAFKKLVISDRTALFVHTVLGEGMSDTPGVMIVLGIFLFNLQLYTDFSGGIDMVQGVSEALGIELAENFRRPFFSRSLAEYWRRWHISLGLWIKDYVFYPIAMSKLFAKFGKKVKTVCGSYMGKTLPGALTSVITFVLIGIWHDVTWCYVLYGLWHGIILGLSNLCEPFLQRINHVLEIRTDVLSFRWFQRVRTWMLISIGESFTLAGSLAGLRLMSERILQDFKYHTIVTQITEYGLDGANWLVLSCAVLILIFVSMKQESGVRIREAMEKQNLCFQWIMTAGIIAVTAVFGVYGPGYDAAAFIYGGV